VLFQCSWPGVVRLFFSLQALLVSASGSEETLRFSELVRLLEQNGFRLVREKGSIRYYAKAGVDRLIRVDYHGAKEIPTGTCNAILKAAGLKR
jgi:predicted RNA binding protein YcfA (HicA-like mRNA interferase family)